MFRKRPDHQRFARRLGALMNALGAVALALALWGCAGTAEKREAPAADWGQFTIYMNGPDKTSTDMTFLLEGINIMSEDGTFREVVHGPVEISSTEMAGRQKLLGEGYLPEGKYKSMQIIVKEASVRGKDEKADLALPPEGIEIPVTAEVERGQNTTEFLVWDPDASISEGFMFSPALAVRGERPELLDLLIFVTNEDSDNVSVINMQSEETVATIKTGKRPRGIATSLSKDTQRVYVANSGSGSISVIDPTDNKLENEVPVRFGRKPEGIAVAELEDGRELIFVANFGSDNVSVMDAVSYEEIESVRVGNGPIAVATDPPMEDIVGSRSLSIEDINVLRSYRESFFNVYVANLDSRSVSVIKVDNQGGKIEDVMTVDVEWGPIGLSVDPERARVYVANFNSDKLSIIDMTQIARGNAAGSVSAISNIGTSIVAVMADPSLDRLYLLKEDDGEIMLIRSSEEVIRPDRLSFTTTLGSIPVGRQPRSFIMDPDERKIYVVNRGSDSVSVIDKSTKRQEKVVPVGKRPYGIAVFPEL